MGKHLYLIACPSQRGLSNFFLGNLSQVIGFLPADKELQTQKSASRSSSSSPDLEEEPTKPQVEQDSLNLQCHPVLQETSDEDGDPSFDLVPGKEEVADTGGEPQAASFHPKYLRQPKQPSKQERELHNMTHIPFQPWCVVCQEAKGRASQHKKQKECHPVLQETSDEDDDPSFDLVPGKEEVADTGGEPQAISFHPKYLRRPKQPSKQERELHNMTHIPFQPWCVVCQEAKGRASQHKKQKASTKTSKIQLDYAYIRQPQDKEPTTIST